MDGISDDRCAEGDPTNAAQDHIDDGPGIAGERLVGLHTQQGSLLENRG